MELLKISHIVDRNANGTAILESLSIEIIIIFFTQSNKFWVLFVFSDLRKESSEDYFLPL